MRTELKLRRKASESNLTNKKIASHQVEQFYFIFITDYVNGGFVNMSDKWLYVVIILLQAFFYGIGNPLTKIAYESITPMWCVALRFSFAFLCILLIMGRRTLPVLRSTPIMSYLPASLCMAFCYVLGNASLGLTSATSAGFLMSVAMLFVPLCAALLLGRRYKVVHIPVQLGALLGMYLLCVGGAAVNIGIGELLALLASLFGAAALVLSEKSMRRIDAMSVTTAQIGMTALLGLIAALLTEDIAVIKGVQPEAYGIIAYLTLICSIGGYCMQNIALGKLPAFFVSVLQCACPVLTAIFSALILKEQLTPIGILGAGILLLCINVESSIFAKAKPATDSTAVKS